MDTTSQRRQWLGTLLPPAAWATYFVVVYLLDEWICSLVLLRVPRIEETVVLVTAVLLCVLTLAACFYAGRIALQFWQQDSGAAEAERVRFMSFSGLLMSLMFGLLTIGVGVATIALPLC